MAMWNFFKPERLGKGEDSDRLSALHQKIVKQLPQSSEQQHIEVACIAGLLARIAYVDFKIKDDEVENIKKSLQDWTKLPPEEIEAIATLSTKEIVELAGRENHKYCHPLNDIWDREQKYQLLESLFALAASDGEVAHDEGEEIRIIAKGLKLEHQHFISARATVLGQLAALKK